MGLTYVALRRLRVGDGFRNSGELVPEAKDWPNLHSYVNQGYLAPVQERAKPGPKPKGEELVESATTEQ